MDSDEGINSQGSRRRKKEVSRASSNQVKFSNEVDKSLPEQSIEQNTIRNLLEQEPVKQRFKSMRQHQLEFMSYLRPVLKDQHFDDGDGEGWGFLATHVQQNTQMFADILKERQRQQALLSEREEQHARIKKKIWDQMQKELQAQKDAIEREEALKAEK